MNQDLQTVSNVASFTHPEPTSGASKWPWENLVFEGGGVKGVSYSGALRVLEEEGIYPKHIKRVAGASVGSLCATWTALGFPAQEMARILKSTDFTWLMQDARLGMVGGLFNIFRSFGMNPGARLLEFVGEHLASRTGSKDVTFAQLLERTGRELCVPITNVSRMCIEYCHPKTTPNMPVRVAVTVSMSLPVLMRPYRVFRTLGTGSGAWNEEDLYTDGGVLNNYPLRAFDGWWLSMRPEDTFLRRLHPFSRIEELADPAKTFSPPDPATLGFTAFSADDQDITSAWLADGASPPPRPDTRLSRARKAIDVAIRKRDARVADLESAFGRLLEALANVERSGDGRISRKECEDLFTSGKFSNDDAVLLFGSTNVQDIFTQLDESKDGFVDMGELQKFMDARNVDLTTRLMGGLRTRKALSVGDFMSGLLNTILASSQRKDMAPADRDRTVPIYTDYIGTSDFRLMDADYDFLVESGARYTRAFLDAYAARSQQRRV
ncbi:patatin-like phospholipase family protein [Cystobacter ferrugineus]|uniref:patatin-like phospholipase family protein n=1 Tax=Cystobacter ferrugineus TaxID=83449 RepID=UPI000A04B55B|nr:patatin-like phospholipase family protein [Cystobacter ferrugineus]